LHKKSAVVKKIQKGVRKMKQRILPKLAVVLCFLSVFAVSLGAQNLGDVNNNNTVDIVDALLVAQYYVQ
jgi:cell division protein FtsB